VIEDDRLVDKTNDLRYVRSCFWVVAVVGLAVIVFAVSIVPVLPYAQADQVVTAVPAIKSLNLNEQVGEALAVGTTVRVVVVLVLGATLAVTASIGLGLLRQMR
jgi:hypothetical protein